MTKNPFTPSFGKVPPFLAGRSNILDDLSQAFDEGSGDPNLTTIFIGARGTGKTALLTCAADEAAQRGWLVANVSARPGMLEDILLQSRKAASHLISDESPARLTDVQLGQLVGVEWENKPEHAANWRLNMESLLDDLADQDAGLLITVDEVRADLSEMVDLVSVYQHFVRDNRNVALLMAGLPFKVSELLSQEDISFLRRAQHRYFGRISDVEIKEAFRETVEAAGRKISPDALQKAANSIQGFPYMMQLLGYRSWNQHPDSEELSAADISAGSLLAQEELRTGIFEATYRELSPKDKAFLFAMLEDEDISAVQDIACRMGVKANYAGQYKKRLMEHGVIGEYGRGKVCFELPGFKEYLSSKR